MIGKTFRLSYPGLGYEYEKTYVNESQTYSFRELTNGLYMIMWNELEGTDVFHIIDRNEENIFSHVTYADDNNPNGPKFKFDSEGLVIDVTFN
ncbi:hypothetical protein CONCODRAFT_8570 [Conidiobolus coronatus NRRL 28638]|uniref:MoaF-like domain-containing protein n=1 Tax=Conidiobolus coronatus (strain ATCC 28846 / CBS 209.66 / NRRL 28638) TaxID=796925 RepID=A0A137P236_CONC2|nr:hypothetical protein CONCODRAFT_8570 [Conidiobolus coronatus NRRL 28638]|eukprot:KXN69082.1 hypothetical protein CONCODRAFT_8570 [Conidiobolus coronatus NRRL 28638]